MRLHAITLGEEHGQPARPWFCCTACSAPPATSAACRRASPAAGKRVIALDLRNHGSSPTRRRHQPTPPWPPTWSRRWRRCRPCPAACSGNSMGGKGRDASGALDQPDHVERLIVADIAPMAYRHANQRHRRGHAGTAASMQGMTRAEASAGPGGYRDRFGHPVLSAAQPASRQRASLPSWQIGLSELAARHGRDPGLGQWRDTL